MAFLITINVHQIIKSLIRKLSINYNNNLRASNFIFKYIAFFCIFFSLSSANCNPHEISEIFIEAWGNNKYEAKIKAHEQGMRRAFLLIADKRGIKNIDIKDMPYLALKKVFKPIITGGERSVQEHYNATVTYEYNKAKFYKLLLDYGNDKVNDMFYECLIIPVYKQKNILNIWDQDERWNDIWVNSKEILNNHKIIYPQKSAYIIKKLNAENIFNLTYEDFIEIFPNFLFKKILIITSEYFTNRNTGESLMKIDNYILTPDSAENLILKEDYKLLSLNDIPNKVNLIINKIINDHGGIRKTTLTKPEVQVKSKKEVKATLIVMNMEVEDQKEMKLIINKLGKVRKINHFTIEPDYDKYGLKYKIFIYTEASKFELAEDLYINGLSYKFYNGLYNFINIKDNS